MKGTLRIGNSVCKDIGPIIQFDWLLAHPYLQSDKCQELSESEKQWLVHFSSSQGEAFSGKYQHGIGWNLGWNLLTIFKLFRVAIRMVGYLKVSDSDMLQRK